MNRSSVTKKIVLLLAAALGWVVFLYIPVSSRAAGQAGLFLNPGAGRFLVGSTMDVSVLLDTKGKSVNTIEVELLFPADKLQVASPSVGQSIIQLWPAPPIFSNREGRIYFVGGIPSPGITTSQGVVLTLSFRVIAPGRAEIRFGDQTSILANDGRATNILGQKPAVFYDLAVPAPQGPAISSPTHPDQERWYRDPNPVFNWPRGQFSDGYSFSINRDPSGFPDTTIDASQATASFPNLENGISYFHLRERSGGVWGGVSHYIVKIDNESPASFRINVSPGSRTTNRNPIFRFFTTDALSGFDHFEMKVVPLSGAEVSESLFFEVSSPYQAPNFSNGRYQVVIRAYDRAGNQRDESVAMHIVGSVSQFVDPEGVDLGFMFVPWLWVTLAAGAVLLVLGLILGWFWHVHRRHLFHAFRDDMHALRRTLHRSARGPHAAMTVLIGLSFLASFLVFGYVASAAAAADAIPLISVAPQAYYPLDETLYIEGRAAPGAEVELFFEQNGGAQPVRIKVGANANGEWFFADRLELASGEWTARARATGDPISDWSNPRIIRSVVSGFVLGSFKVRYLPMVATLAVLFIVAIFLLIYAAMRVHRLRHSETEQMLRERTRALERSLRKRHEHLSADMVAQNFARLRGRVSEELTHMEQKAASGAQLSEAERAHGEELLSELRRAESAIEREVRQMP